MPIYETIYSLQSVNSNSAIKTTRQLCINYQNGEKYWTDYQFYLFVLPPENSTYTWKESHSEKNYDCSSQFVYIRLFNDVEHAYQVYKAVKITKMEIDSTGKKNSKGFFSYWIKGLSRIATYYVGESQEPVLSSIILQLSKSNKIEEISIKELNR